MTETTWEAVEYGDLKPGDKVRLTHQNGDVIHTEVFEALGGKAVAIFDAGRSTDILAANGYRFQRAVPEWEPPTEPGLYMSAAKCDPNFHPIYLRGASTWSRDTSDGGTNGWQDFPPERLPRDLVRFAPVGAAQ